MDNTAETYAREDAKGDTGRMDWMARTGAFFEGRLYTSLTVGLTSRGRLLNLWDMAHTLLPIGRDISLTLFSLVGAYHRLDRICKTQGSDAPLSADLPTCLQNCIGLTDELAKNLSLQTSRIAALQAKSSIENNPTNGDAFARIRELHEAVLRDLFKPLWISATEDMANYLDKASLFGPDVARVFMDCTEDIAEAHTCFAFERYTAAMFHLGRAMEIAVKQFALKIGAVAPSRDEWQRWLNSINSVIDAMPHNSPADREARLPYCEAAGYFLHFKDAWRNQTAHPKKTYTRQEAIDILNGAKAFMDAIARNFF